MLRSIAVVAACTTGLVLVSAEGAWAKSAPPPPVLVHGDFGGVIHTTVTSPGHPGSSHRPGASSVSSSTQCTWLAVGSLLPGAAAVTLIGSGIAPATADGVWYEQYCNGWVPPPVFVPNTANNQPKPTHTPQTLALQAVNELPLPTPAVKHSPSGDALVNLPTWWWVDPAQSAALTQTTTAGAVWATVTAKPARSTWDAGDGSPVLTCTGAGTPYDVSKSADGQTSACTHTYASSSAAQKQTGPSGNDRFFTVKVTVFWQVSYVGSGGATGTLPEMSRSATFPLRVDERQTVVTGGSG